MLKKVQLSDKLYKQFIVDLALIETRYLGGLPWKKGKYSRRFNLENIESDIIGEFKINSSPEKSNFLKIRINFNLESMTVVKIRYRGLLSALSFMGGLFKGMSFFFFILIWPFREILYYKKLINTMFDVCSDADDLTNAFDHLIHEDKDDEGGLTPKEKTADNLSSTEKENLENKKKL